MSAAVRINDPARRTSLRLMPRHVAVVRAVLALVWAAAVALAVGDDVPTTDTDLPTAAALLIASYPLIDVIASLASSAFGDARVLRFNAAVSSLAMVGIAIAAFGSDAGATLVAFGAWAAASGAIQLGIAIHRRRARGRQVPMIVSGGLSTIAGLSFIAASGDDKAHLAALSGYMALAAVLFLLWARRRQGDSARGPGR
jgi:uncharacterized membrane protein HdeD (DUF308 family)